MTRQTQDGGRVVIVAGPLFPPYWMINASLQTNTPDRFAGPTLVALRRHT